MAIYHVCLDNYLFEVGSLLTRFPQDTSLINSGEFRQQIKTFRLKYVFMAEKIIRTARYVVLKLPKNRLAQHSSSRDVFLKMHGIIIGLNKLNLFFHLDNMVESHENTETPSVESLDRSVFE